MTLNRPQQTGVVGDFGHRGYGAARVGPSSRSLLDCDYRRQPVNKVHLGSFHLVEQLPGAGGQTVHVFPITLGIKSIESQ